MAVGRRQGSGGRGEVAVSRGQGGSGDGGQGAVMWAGGRGQATGEAVGGRLLEEVAANLRAGSDCFRCVV